jgi:hypothetical protein
MDLLGLIISALLTLMIFSYLLRDSLLYRWALAVLVGTASGYATAIAIRFVANEWISLALSEPETNVRLIYISVLLLGCLLLLKGFAPTRFAGLIMTVSNIPLGYLVGVGAAVAVSGALMGTLIPQVLATGSGLRLDPSHTFPYGLLTIAQGIVVALSTIVTLLSFSISYKRSPGYKPGTGQRIRGQTWKRICRGTGRAVVAVALGAAFAGAITSALTALMMRMWQLADLLSRWTALMGG